MGSVVRFFEQDLITDGQISDLGRGDMRENVGLEPQEGEFRGAGGQGRENFVGNADYQTDSGPRKRL